MEQFCNFFKHLKNAKKNLRNQNFDILLSKIRRGPKLEGCAFANFENSSGTEGQSAKVKERKNKTENNFR